MSMRGSNRVNNGPNVTQEVIMAQKHNVVARKCGFTLLKMLELSPGRFFKGFGSMVAKHLRLKQRRSSTDISSGRSKTLTVASFDSGRSEAIEDCIEFINSSSSLRRSNSVPANSV